MSYYELSVEERAIIQVGQARGFSRRWLARLLKRAPSTISREIRRNRVTGDDVSTDAKLTHPTGSKLTHLGKMQLL